MTATSDDSGASEAICRFRVEGLHVAPKTYLFNVDLLLIIPPSIIKPYPRNSFIMSPQLRIPQPRKKYLGTSCSALFVL